MSTTTWLTIFMGLYLLLMAAVGLYAGRQVKNEEDYAVAGRRLPLSLAWATLLATWFGAATILGAAEAARDEGLRGVILDPFASGAALIVAGLFFAGPLRRMELVTIGDFYARVFGRKTEWIACLVMVPSYFGWIGAQFVALSEIQYAFWNIPHVWGVVIGAGVIFLLTLIGGMWSVTLTDAVQMVLIFIGLIILAGRMLLKLGDGTFAGGLQTLVDQTPPEMLTLLPEAGLAAGAIWLGTWFSGAFGNIPGQDLMQRVFSSKSESVARQSCVLAGVLYVALGMLPVGMGLASRLILPGNSESRILVILSQQFLTPALAAVFVISLTSIIVSTATSAVLSSATLLAHNLCKPLFHTATGRLRGERAAVFLITLAGVGMAFSGQRIMGLLELSVSITLVGLFVPLVFGIYGQSRGEAAAIAAIAAGTLVWLARELMEGLLLPISAEAATAGMNYADFVAARFGATTEQIGLGTVPYLFALVPSALSGTAASLAAYLAVGLAAKPSAAKQATPGERQVGQVGTSG